MTVQTGAQRLLRDPGMIRQKKWGLVTNYTAVLPNLELTATALHRETGAIAAIFGPEHGLRGTAQAGFAEKETTDPVTGLPLVDTYGLDEDALDQAIRELGIDAMVADIQDVGARFYTYAWTVVDCMRSAARLGIPFYVLDRPNPLSGAVREGPGVVPADRSFVGRLDIPIRHGLTLGELVREASARDAAAGLVAEPPQVVLMSGWERKMYWDDTGLPWVMPSPNLPTPDSALVYVGTALFEGTNMSEGRGTTRPFELVGAPWLDEEYAKSLQARALPGVSFRSDWFVPTFQKHAGEPVGGVQLHVTDRDAFNPVLTAVTMLEVAKDLGGDQFEWRMPDWESDQDARPFIDLLWGSDTLRRNLGESRTPTELLEASPQPGIYLTEMLY